MQSYSAVITINIDEFEANDDDHANDIAAIFMRRTLDARICESSDIEVSVDTFIKDEEND